MTKPMLLVLKESNTELLVSPRFTWVFFLATKDETSIKREYSVARTPQQNGVAKRRNRTLIEAARTMLADSKLTTTFWAEAVSTACYVYNRVLIVKPHNKTPYELFRGIKPALSFMKPFGCHVTILNTLDSLGKFDGKSDEGFFVGYSLSKKAFRVYNTRTKKVQALMNLQMLHILIPSKQMGNDDPQFVSNDPKEKEDGSTDECNGKERLSTVGSSVNTATPEDMVGPSHSLEATHDEFFHDVDDTAVDLGNILNSYIVSTTPHTRIHINHPLTNVISDIQSPVQTRKIKEPTSKQGLGRSNARGASTVQTSKYLDLCRLPKGHRAIGSKWVFRNKKDERGIVIRNKARLVAQGNTQEEGIDYDEVFVPVARIEAIRLFLAYASFMGYMVYQMDVKSTFLYGQIEDEVYVCQPLGFEDPDYPDKVYRVMKALYGLHQAPRA
ncbi:retrovirus-related pol polyprotein from transposon TNT 1-94, partial [Tanacetum coccineum]